MDTDEQSDLSLLCLLERLLKHFSRRQKQTNIVVIGALSVRTGSHIKLVRIANREDPNQIAYSEAV